VKVKSGERSCRPINVSTCLAVFALLPRTTFSRPAIFFACSSAVALSLERRALRSAQKSLRASRRSCAMRGSTPRVCALLMEAGSKRLAPSPFATAGAFFGPPERLRGTLFTKDGLVRSFEIMRPPRTEC
jgi:hypothetical protein